MVVRIVASDLRSIPEAKIEALGIGYRAYAAAALLQGFPECFAVISNSADDSYPGDDHSAHQDAAGAGSLGVSP
jgi:hypothetical protein